MGINDWWTVGLGDFKSSAYKDISEFKGERFAVDLSILMNKFLCSDIDKLATTSTPAYPAPDLIQNIKNWHENLSKHVTLVYVFDGKAPPHKKYTKEQRREQLEGKGKEWLELRESVLKNANQTINERDVKKATASRMAMSHPTAVDHAAIRKWMGDNGIEHYGSLYEADQQMIQLEKDGIVDGIISEDGDEIALGAKRLLCKMSRKSNGEYQFKLFDREHFMSNNNPYQSKLCTYPDLITDAALTLGNDYCPRVEGNGPTTVLLGSLEPIKPNASEEEKKNRKRLCDSMLDKLAAASDREAWINNFGRKGKQPLSTSQSAVYWNSRKYMLHAPVLQYEEVTGQAIIVPLNPLPDGVVDLGEYLGLDDLATLQDDKPLLLNIYHCRVIPIERKPLNFYEDRLSSAIFGELHFSEDPVKIQPTLCLVNFLRARSLDARMDDGRDKIEDAVGRCIRVNKRQSSLPLRPVAGVHDGFKKIAARQADNEFDIWNHDCSTFASKLERIDDDVIDRLLGKSRKCRPSIRHRVANLVRGGHYDIASIKCRNVAIKSNGNKCVLICCDCLSSKSSTFHTVYAVFEDEEGGKYQLDASSCSCKKGEYFCSHSIGFLYVMRLLQHWPQTEVKKNYRVNPKLIQSELMLIENSLIGDKFKQQNSQRKRQRRI